MNLRPLSEARLLVAWHSSGRGYHRTVSLAVTEVKEGASQSAKVQRAFPRCILDRRDDPGRRRARQKLGKKRTWWGGPPKVYKGIRYMITSAPKKYTYTQQPHCLRLSRLDSSFDLCYVLLGHSFLHLLRGFENLAVHGEMLTLEP
jgi:hypothetical protein